VQQKRYHKFCSGTRWAKAQSAALKVLFEAEKEVPAQQLLCPPPTRRVFGNAKWVNIKAAWRQFVLN
jgi:hypothetical protein